MKEDWRKLREEIDGIDNRIMKLLNRRFAVCKQIGREKFSSGAKIENLVREAEIKHRIYSYEYYKELETVYHTVFTISKTIQNYDYFLLGKSINHSLSPLIYQMFGLSGYNLYPTDDAAIIKKTNFKGANITNPYKRAVFALVDSVSPEALLTGVVNTVLKAEGRLIGYNTDYYGFEQMLTHYSLNPGGRKIVIIGNGATARTVTAVLEKYHPAAISYLVRTVRAEGDYPLEQYTKFIGYDIIINTTPCGFTEPEPLFPLTAFTDLEAVIDILYAPPVTPLLREAARYRIPGYNGLYMLVAQAAASYRIYTGADKTAAINSVYQKLKKRLVNIILIGMPYAGKTTLGCRLSGILRRPLIDIDLELSKKKISLFTVDESEFRKREAALTVNYAHKTGLIIATGGGIILNPEAMAHLKENGVVVFLDTPLEVLATRLDDTRPLIRSNQDLEQLYEQRINLYRQYADIVVAADEIDKIGAMLDEYFSD